LDDGIADTLVSVAHVYFFDGTGENLERNDRLSVRVDVDSRSWLL
jgi:hypothetical protein